MAKAPEELSKRTNQWPVGQCGGNSVAKDLMTPDTNKAGPPPPPDHGSKGTTTKVGSGGFSGR